MLGVTAGVTGNSSVTRSGNGGPPPTPTPLLQEGAVIHGARSWAGIFLRAQEGSLGDDNHQPFSARTVDSRQVSGTAELSAKRGRRSPPARGQQTLGHVAYGSPTPGGTTPGQAPPQNLLCPPDRHLGGTPEPRQLLRALRLILPSLPLAQWTRPLGNVSPPPTPRLGCPVSACAWQVPSLQGALQRCCCCC